jgi:hypothetical protein
VRGLVALALAAACGRIDFDPLADGSAGDSAPRRCNWVGGPNLHDERWRDDLSTPDQDSDPFLVRGDPLAITLTRVEVGRGYDLFIASRPTLAAPFDPPTLVAELSTTGNELALQLDAAGHGYFIKQSGADTDLFEVQRVDGTLQIVRPLDEINDLMRQYDPHGTADGLAFWFATQTATADQDILIAHRSDQFSMWGGVESFAYNSPNGDAGATLTDDQLVVVWTSREATGTNNDIYYSTRPSLEDPFSAPQKLSLVPDLHEIEPSIRGDGCELLFSRASALGDQNWDIYSVDID